MITVFYYIYNNLNLSYIIVSHHEAERVVTVTITNISSTVKVENPCISIILKVTAAHQPKYQKKEFINFSLRKF